ncbi:putative E3 ubiquitin-protein ligase RHG1A [Citrus sinensis]|uniref:E3 ubiquitin-protein ligase RHG1A n=1 Tax=Citrus sinensis TaxID=2711 RepID=A0ACB8KUP7_CITSI|nr:putative E3 ubiquitin-protein ligase RHG1A [Citrus sinensis]
MQGQRGTIGSLPETLSFDHGSTSTSAVDQQMFWNNMRNPPESRPPDNMLSPAGTRTTMTYVNSMSHEQQMSTAWSLGEPSSHGPQNKVTHDERRTQHGWQCEPTSSMPVDGANVNPMLVQSSNSNMMSQNLNLNAGFVSDDGDNFQVMGCPNLHKSGSSVDERIPPPGSSDSFLLPSGSGGYLAEENNGRPGSSSEGGRRASCKRKALEGNVENSSVGGTSSYFQHAESSACSAVSASYNGGSSLSISDPSGQVNSGRGLGVRGPVRDGLPEWPVAGNAERSRRNYRVRIHPSNQQKVMPYAQFPTNAAVRHSSISSTQESSRLPPNDQSLDSMTAPSVENTGPQSQPVLLHVPMFPQNLQPFRWDKGSSSRSGSSSSSNGARDRDVQREEARPRIMGRNILENPMFIPAPDLRNLVRSPANRSLAGGNISTPGNVASSSRAGSSSGVHPPSAPTWVPHPNPYQYPRRFSELIRRSLTSSSGSESAGQSSNQTPPRSVPLSPEEMVLSSGAGNQRHHPSYPRSASRLERQDGVLGFPHPLRALAAVGEGRNRVLVSEQIRNVLDLMRRGEGLQFEDVMILDQSVFFGVADINDRHRDMRLDVDNMSYEELLALEERIGNVSTGLTEETIKNRLKQQKYSISLGSQQEQEPCCICQAMQCATCQSYASSLKLVQASPLP